jgi:hypothetical protein
MEIQRAVSQDPRVFGALPLQLVQRGPTSWDASPSLPDPTPGPGDTAGMGWEVESSTH